MSDYEVGDRVRLSVEGTIVGVDPHGVRIRDTWFNTLDQPDAFAVEVLDHRAAQNGDVIATKQGLDRLHENSVVVGADGEPLIVVAGGIRDKNGTWSSYSTGTDGPFVIVYAAPAL